MKLHRFTIGTDTIVYTDRKVYLSTVPVLYSTLDWSQEQIDVLLVKDLESALTKNHLSMLILLYMTCYYVQCTEIKSF